MRMHENDESIQHQMNEKQYNGSYSTLGGVAHMHLCTCPSAIFSPSLACCTVSAPQIRRDKCVVEATRERQVFNLL